MMDVIQNIARLQAMLHSQESGKPEFATVSSYDPKTYMAKVIFEERQEQTESPWMQIMTQGVGNGWGLFTPPPIGAQVIVDFIGGDKEVGVIRGGCFNRQDRCAVVPSGEMWLVHKTGACLKMTNDGKITLSGSQTDIIGFLNSVGSANVSGNLAVGTGASGSFTTPTGQIVTVSGGVITNIF